MFNAFYIKQIFIEFHYFVIYNIIYISETIKKFSFINFNI